MDLPLHQKMAYEEGDDGMQFGYVHRAVLCHKAI